MRIGHHAFAFIALISAPIGAGAASETADQVGNSAEAIATKPLKDANVIKTEIPPKLQSIMAQPYSLAGLKTCADFEREIAELTKVLGPDVDSIQPKKGASASETVLAEMENAAGRLVPASGLIRKVSGAEAQEKKAKAAVYAGSLRRAYLKGTARTKGCKV